MIDWLDIVLTVNHSPINAGHMISVLPNGEIEYDVAKAAQHRGSFDTTIRVRSQGGDGSGNASELFLSGNPSKFLQGHNVFGSKDICHLSAEVARSVFASFGIGNDLDIARILRGEFDVKRVDITESWAFPNRRIVKAVLGALAVKSRSRMGRPQSRGGTVYHGMNSRRHTFKFYCKGDELEAGKKHALHHSLEDTPLKEFADNLLRGELTLRSKELTEREINRGSDLTEEKLMELYTDYFGRIEMAAQADIPSDEVMALSRAHRSTYLMWKEGIDVRSTCSDSTFYSHRNALLPYGVDISLPCESSDCKVIPLFQSVTGRPVDVPQWAFSMGLVSVRANP